MKPRPYAKYSQAYQHFSLPLSCWPSLSSLLDRLGPQRIARFLLLTLSVLITQTSYAAFNHHNTDINNWINHAEAGVLLMRADTSQPPSAALLLNTDVGIEISGPIAKVTLTQQFKNTGQNFSEGIYVFPLPENSSVHHMEMRIGERRIVGEIHEKQQAKKIYEAAKQQGKTASLLEQRRPNIFTSSVANISPNDTVEITIKYIEVLARDGNQFSLRFPMTITPRYNPKAPDTQTSTTIDPREIVSTVSSLSHHNSSQSQVDDGAYLPPGSQYQNSNRATLSIQLHGGDEITQLYSRSHQIDYNRHSDRYDIRPWDNALAMDRDFLLSWTLKPNGLAQATHFIDKVGDDYFMLLMLVPQRQTNAYSRLPREMIFIIDTSGSMGGESIRQAKQALESALTRLHPGDRFNIIEFDSRYTTLFPQPVVADQQSIAQATRFVRQLQADGGTEMLAPLKAALAYPESEGYLRQVMFITDGAVGNEHAIFQTVHTQLNNARLFTVGIGSAPNSYFMRKAAEFGRGTFTYINSTDEVALQMSSLFERLEKPLMRDIAISMPNHINAEMFPPRIPDLYAGEPLVVTLKLDTLPSQIDISGLGTRPWQSSLNIEQPLPSAYTSNNNLHQTDTNSGISTLWARHKIESLYDRITRGEDEAQIKPQIINVALMHQLVSRYTSFVSVDQTPVRPDHSPLKTDNVANLSPKGLAWPKTATGVNQLWIYACIMLLLSLLLMPHHWLRRSHGGH